MAKPRSYATIIIIIVLLVAAVGGWFYWKTSNGKPPDFYTAKVSRGDLVQSITATGIIQIDVSAPFLLFNRHMFDTVDPTIAAPGLDGQYENAIAIQDSSNNYNWSSDFVPRSGFARDRMHGFNLSEECLLDGNTRLLVTIKNPATGATAGITTLTLQGYSLYPV